MLLILVFGTRNAGDTVRHQHAIGAQDVKLLYNIVPEAAVYLGGRDIVQVSYFYSIQSSAGWFMCFRLDRWC